MQCFTGYDYVLIDIANQYGKDKELFEERIQWATEHLSELESLAGEAETPPLYMKAVMALRKAQKGIPTGHLVGMDACCSGIQLMSVLTGCVAGATATGLVDPNVRADAYTATTEAMRGILGSGFDVSRKDAKQALMTSCYGSKKTPKDIFGEDTAELSAFYAAASKIAPGAWDLLSVLLASWRPYALSHEWQLPDGFEAKVKVMQDKESRIEVDELDHASFTYVYYVNEGSKTGLSNIANVIHSVDALVLRSIHRRCNYDHMGVEGVVELLEQEWQNPTEAEGTDLSYYIDLWQRTGLADVVVFPYLTEANVGQLPKKMLLKLHALAKHMLSYQPFEVVTIHDEFKCSPNNMNHLRQQYINVLADLADSTVLDDLLTQLYGEPGSYPKLSNNLSELIQGSNYGLS